MLEETVLLRFFGNPEIIKLKKEMDLKVLDNEITPTLAVNTLLNKYYGEK